MTARIDCVNNYCNFGKYIECPSIISTLIMDIKSDQVVEMIRRDVLECIRYACTFHLPNRKGSLLFYNMYYNVYAYNSSVKV